MKFKKIMAAVLCAAMTASVCACNSNKKSASEIEKVLKEYEAALQETDGDAVLDLASWDEGDDDYANIEQLFEDANYTIDMESFKGYIASTIKVYFDSEDIEIEGDKASVKVTYELVDWEKEYFSVSRDPDDLLDKLKDSDDTTRVRGRIKLELIDGEWKITKINKLGDVFYFCFAYAYIDVPETDYTIDITDTEPLPTSTDIDPLDSDEIFYRAIKHYIAVLSENEAAIRNIENHYNTPYCGLFDLNMDGYPELYFFAGTDTDIYAADLYVYTYNPYADEAINVFTIPYAIYSAGDGGGVMIYYTTSEVLFALSFADDMDYSIETRIVDFNWNPVASYKRVYAFSPESSGTIYYENYVEVEEDYFTNIMKNYINDTQCVVFRGIGIKDDYVEAPLRNLPTIDMVTFDEMYSILDSMI